MGDISKDIVIVNQSSGYLMVDIANEFCKAGYDVTLISSSDMLPNADPNLKFLKISRYRRDNIKSRISSWVRGYIQIRSILKKILNKSSQIIYVSNPPFSYFLAKKFNNPFSIIIYDLYPDALNNIKCPSFIKNYWTKKNLDIFAKARKIFVLSNGMKNEVQKYSPAEKIGVVPLWIRNENNAIIPAAENKFIIDNNLQNKFIILYSGNMGYTHNLEPLINVAAELKHIPDIVFVFIGAGGKKQLLMEKAKGLNLRNCLFFPYFSVEDTKYTLSSASLGIVAVSNVTANVSVPSKTFNLLSYKVPILAIAPEESEISNLLTEYKCGKNFSGASVQTIKDWILYCKDNYEYFHGLKENAGMAMRNFTKANAKMFLEAVITH